MENSEALPLISIIVPVYNVEKYLEKCLHSICEQTYKNLEIIVVDDGSTDGSGEICDLLAKEDKRIKVIHQPNAGLSAARNRGLDIASGEYIGFVDSDDWIDVDMYQFLYELLTAKKADISICSLYVEKPGKTKVKYCSTEILELNKQRAIQILAEDKIIRNYACDKLFAKRLFESIRFPEKRFFEDIAIMYRVFYEAEKIVMQGQPKYHYLTRDDSIMRSKYNPRKEYHLFMAVYEQNKFILEKQLWHKTPIFVIRRGIHLVDHIMLTPVTRDTKIIVDDVLQKMSEYKQITWRQIGLVDALKRWMITNHLMMYRSGYRFVRTIFNSRRHRF